MFKTIGFQRGDEGVFRNSRQELKAAGKERWYTLPLQGGDQDVSGGGLIAYAGPSVAWSTWATNGLFTVDVIPPG